MQMVFMCHALYCFYACFSVGRAGQEIPIVNEFCQYCIRTRWPANGSFAKVDFFLYKCMRNETSSHICIWFEQLILWLMLNFVYWSSFTEVTAECLLNRRHPTELLAKLITRYLHKWQEVLQTCLMMSSFYHITGHVWVTTVTQ